MKIYVDEFPKDCWDCPMHDGENGRCKMLVCYTDYIPKDCPLQSISDHDKQVRKEVCEKIKETAIIDDEEYRIEPNLYKITEEELDTILKEYQK